MICSTEGKSESELISLVISDPYWIISIKNPTEAIQLATVNKKGNAIKYIKNPSEEVQLAAVKQYGYAIMHIENPSEEVQLAAVKENGWAIFYIKDPSEEVQLASINEYIEVIKHINNPSKDMCKQAIILGAKEEYFPWNTMTEEVKQYVRDCLLVKDIME